MSVSDTSSTATSGAHGTEIRARLRDILREERFGVIQASLFGSYARSQQRPESDLDLLVKLAPDKTFFDLLRLQLALEDALHRRVDVLTFEELASAHPLFRAHIQADMEVIQL